MNATTFASHGISHNWLRPDATARSLQLRDALRRSLTHDLALVLGPGILGIAALAVLMLLMN